MYYCKPGAQSYSRSDTLVLSHVRWTHTRIILSDLRVEAVDWWAYCQPDQELLCMMDWTPWAGVG